MKKPIYQATAIEGRDANGRDVIAGHVIIDGQWSAPTAPVVYFHPVVARERESELMLQWEREEHWARLNHD